MSDICSCSTIYFIRLMMNNQDSARMEIKISTTSDYTFSRQLITTYRKIVTLQLLRSKHSIVSSAPPNGHIYEADLSVRLSD